MKQFFRVLSHELLWESKTYKLKRPVTLTVTAICCNVSKALVISWLVMQSSVLVIQHFSSAFEHF